MASTGDDAFELHVPVPMVASGELEIVPTCRKVPNSTITQLLTRVLSIG